MFTFAYPAVFSRDEDGRSLVGFPDFPTARTDGADPSEAMEEAIDCLAAASRSPWLTRQTYPSRPV
jgi:predicted RNase H-like HicB family nuclease